MNFHNEIGMENCAENSRSHVVEAASKRQNGLY